jgi:signal transduction histidine kinase
MSGKEERQGMQAQPEHFQDEDTECIEQAEMIAGLQRQVNELTSTNLLLKEQLARKEQFIAMIAHDLRGPLSPIINYAQLLTRYVSRQSGETDGRRQRSDTIQRSTTIIISQARRLLRLVNDLHDATRLTSGQFSLVRESCNLTTLVKDAVEYMRPVAPYHTFIVHTPDELIVGNWDGGRLQQVLGNLLDNAFKYSDEGTTITVRVWTTARQAHVSVHNQGASIPASDIALLFRPYARLSATSSRRGSGLGLHIARSIVEAHGGSLRLESHAEEGGEPKGTTFLFDLPLS